MGRFARYELQDRIGLGGMAEVWAARGFRSDGSSRDLVMKRILPHLASDPDFEAMLMEEARGTSLLLHPNIVQTLDWGKLDDTCFIALERVVGIDGRGLLDASADRGEHIPAPVALFVVAKILDALDHAHGRCDERGDSLGIVHRDISPANILLSTRGEVKLTDFGIARAKSRASRTQVGQVRGKPRYMSPEQARGEELDARSDIFAAGLVLFEFLTGEPAFVGGDTIEEVVLGLKRGVPLPSQRRADLPPGIDALVKGMCELAPNARYATAADARAAITGFARRRNLRLQSDGLSSLVQSFAEEPAGPAPSVTRVFRVDDLSGVVQLTETPLALGDIDEGENTDRTRVRRDVPSATRQSVAVVEEDRTLVRRDLPPVTDSYFDALLSENTGTASRIGPDRTEVRRSPQDADEADPSGTVAMVRPTPAVSNDDTAPKEAARSPGTTIPSPPWIALPVLVVILALVAMIFGERGGPRVAPTPAPTVSSTR